LCSAVSLAMADGEIEMEKGMPEKLPKSRGDKFELCTGRQTKVSRERMDGMARSDFLTNDGKLRRSVWQPF